MNRLRSVGRIVLRVPLAQVYACAEGNEPTKAASLVLFIQKDQSTDNRIGLESWSFVGNKINGMLIFSLSIDIRYNERRDMRFQPFQTLALMLLFYQSTQRQDPYSQVDSAAQQVLTLSAAGNTTQAIAVGEPAMSHAASLLGPGDPKLIELESIMATVYARAGRELDAESVLNNIVKRKL